MFAIEADDTHTVKSLIGAEADINVRDRDGRDALWCAAHYMDHKAVSMLLNAGAAFNKVSEDGETPLVTALQYSYFSDPEMRDRGEKTVNMLIEAGTDVNIQNSSGETALYRAVRNHYTMVIPALFEAGAVVNIADNDGDTPLIAASCHENSEIVKELVKWGADVNFANNCGRSALLVASLCCKPDTIEILVKADANVNVVDDKHCCALHVDYIGQSVMYAYLNCIKILLRAGVEINHIPYGDTFELNTLKTILARRHRFQCAYKDVAMLLFAAEETLEEGDVFKLHYKLYRLFAPLVYFREIDDVVKIPKMLKFEEKKLELKHICRMAIQKYLVKIDPHSNLFRRIPKLGLPSQITKYLLFNVSLEWNWVVFQVFSEEDSFFLW